MGKSVILTFLVLYLGMFGDFQIKGQIIFLNHKNAIYKVDLNNPSTPTRLTAFSAGSSIDPYIDVDYDLCKQRICVLHSSDIFCSSDGIAAVTRITGSLPIPDFIPDTIKGFEFCHGILYFHTDTEIFKANDFITQKGSWNGETIQDMKVDCSKGQVFVVTPNGLYVSDCSLRYSPIKASDFAPAKRNVRLGIWPQNDTILILSNGVNIGKFPLSFDSSNLPRPIVSLGSLESSYVMAGIGGAANDIFLLYVFGSLYPYDPDTGLGTRITLPLIDNVILDRSTIFACDSSNGDCLKPVCGPECDCCSGICCNSLSNQICTCGEPETCISLTPDGLYSNNFCALQDGYTVDDFPDVDFNCSECEIGPNMVANGKYTFSSEQPYYAQTTAMLQCDEGYDETPETCTLTCNKCGKFANDTCSCEPLNCGNHTSSSPHATFTYDPDTTLGSTATLICSPGFPSFDSSFNCMANGFWSGLDPACSNITCEQLIPPSKGVYLYNDATSTATLSCEDGYTATPGGNRSCDGISWNPVTEMCDFLVGACKLETIISSGVQYTFTPSTYDEVIGSIETCPEDSGEFGSPLATRRCTENGWDEEVLTDCFTNVNEKLEDIADTTVTEENIEEVAEKLALATSQTEAITSEGVDDVANSLESIANLEEPSPEVTTSVVEAVNNIMEVSEEVLTASTEVSTIVNSLKKQVSTLSRSGLNYTEVEDNVAVQTVSIPEDASVNYLCFANLISKGRRTLDTTFQDDSTRLYFEDSDIPVSSISVSISIPTAILQDGELRTNANFIIYANDVLFQSKTKPKNNAEQKDAIVSRVISGNVEGEDVKDLDDNIIIIRFFIDSGVLSKLDSSTKPTCVFWNESTSTWSEKGCTIAVDSIEGVIVCECNHLTSFAVLLSVGGEVNSAISIISKIGCVISMAALALSIIFFTCFLTMKKFSTFGKEKMHIKIHLNLSIALFCLYLFFVVGIDSTNEAFCTTTAILLHHFLVASMTWMTLEAINIIYMIKNPIRFSQGRHIPHFFLAASILGWGLPWLPVIIVSAVDKKTYTRNLPQYCYMAPGLPLYLATLLPVAILLIFNLIIFALCVNFLRESSKKRMRNSTAETNTEMIALARGALAICVLLGLTWIFGFFAVGEIGKTFAVLFTIFNSLQGLAIFLLFCVRQKEFQILVCRKKLELTADLTASTWTNIRPSSSSKPDDEITAEISLAEEKTIKKRSGNHEDTLSEKMGENTYM